MEIVTPYLMNILFIEAFNDEKARIYRRLHEYFLLIDIR